MNGGWKRTAIALVLATSFSAVGLCCAGLLSAPDAVTISLAMVMSTSMLGAVGSVVACYLRLWRQVRVYLDRPPLSDEEFADLFASDIYLDRDVLQQVRQLAATRFRSLGGDRFYPGDRLEGDLHLFDVAPWAFEDFWIEFEEAFREGDEVSSVDIVTFGDVVLEANRRREMNRPTPHDT